jgi:hypothetical protein
MLDPLKGIDGDRPKDLFPWHFNLRRQRVSVSAIERTVCSATGKDEFYLLEKFAKLWGSEEATPRSFEPVLSESTHQAHPHPSLRRQLRPAIATGGDCTLVRGNSSLG